MSTPDCWCDDHDRGLEGCDDCGDQFPYVGEHGSRHAYPGTLNGKPLIFAPRPSAPRAMTTTTGSP